MRTSYKTRRATTNCHKEKTFTHKQGKNKNYDKAQKKTKET